MSANDNAPQIDSYMKLKEVMKVTTLGSTTIYRKMKSGDFPLARELGPNCVRWRESEVLAWMNSRPAAHAVRA